MRFDIRRLTPAYFTASLLALLGAWLMLRGGSLEVQIVRGAAGIDDRTPDGLEGFIQACDELIDPMLIAAASATPLAVIGGGVLAAFGSRRGMQIVITALFTLALLGSAQGIVS